MTKRQPLKTGFKVQVFENGLRVNNKKANFWRRWCHAHAYYVFSLYCFSSPSTAWQNTERL